MAFDLGRYADRRPVRGNSIEILKQVKRDLNRYISNNPNDNQAKRYLETVNVLHMLFSIGI